MKEIEKKIPNYESLVMLQSMVAPVLLHLSNSGVTNEDIIGMNNLVVAFRNKDFLSDTPNQVNQENKETDTNPNNIKNWSLFIEKLESKKYRSRN